MLTTQVSPKARPTNILTIHITHYHIPITTTTHRGLNDKKTFNCRYQHTPFHNPPQYQKMHAFSILPKAPAMSPKIHR